MRRPVAAAVAAAILVVLAVVLAVVLTRPEASVPGDPHAGVGAVDPDRLDSILNAAETAGAQRSQAELAAEGRSLFRSTAVAKAGESCQSCHVDGGGADFALGAVPHPQATGDFRGLRDVPSLWGVAETAPYGWAAQEERLEDFVTGTIESHFTDGRSQPADVTGRQVAALTAYLRTLEPPVTEFDLGTLSPAALRGEELFQGKAGCMACHSGALLTDNALHDTLVPKGDPADTDTGAAARGPLKGTFNTPHLRDLEATAPYMHNGSLATLRDVVEFYDRSSSVAPLGLTPGEVDDLVAYLESL